MEIRLNLWRSNQERVEYARLVVEKGINLAVTVCAEPQDSDKVRGMSQIKIRNTREANPV